MSLRGGSGWQCTDVSTTTLRNRNSDARPGNDAASGRSPDLQAPVRDLKAPPRIILDPEEFRELARIADCRQGCGELGRVRGK